MSTAQDIVTRVRDVINDTSATPRNSNEEIFRWISDALSLASTSVPRLFSKTADMICSAGYLQTLAFTRALSFIEVIGFPQVDVASLTAFAPGWKMDTAGPIQHWFPSADSPKSFCVYPPSQGDQTITVTYVESPAPVTSASDVLNVPDVVIPAVVQFCVGMVESKDDEHVNSNRAAQAKADFVALIKGA